MRPVLLYAVVGVCLPLVALSQGTVRSSEDVAREFFRAKYEGRWLDAARMMDLRLVDQARREFINNLVSSRRVLSVEKLKEIDPQMPRAVAVYQVERMKKSQNDVTWITNEYARVTSVESLAALSSEEAGARWLEARDPVAQIERSKVEDLKNCESPTAAQSFPKPEGPEFLSAAIVPLQPGAGDSVRYFLYYEYPYTSAELARRRDRNGFRDVSPPPDVLTLVLVGGAWRVLPKESRHGSMFARVACAPKQETPRKKRD